MQTALRITDGGLSTPYHQRNRMHRYQSGDKRQKKKKVTTNRGYNDFLMGRILPISPHYYIEVGKEEKINLTSEENFNYLYCSALKYTKLAGIDLPFHKIRNNPRINIINLYKALDTILPENINLEENGERLYFCLYRFHNWPEPHLFWIPLDFTERLPKQLKRIALEFIRQFAQHHGIQDVTENFYYEMAHSYLEVYGNYVNEATRGEIRKKENLARAYKEGKIHRILKKLGEKKFCTDLPGEIQKYHTKKNNEQKLLKLIKEGTKYISSGSPSIMQYDYDWAYEESPEFRPIGLDTQIMLTYSIDDAMMNEMTNYFNSDYQESYAITPTTTLYLTPETNQLFTIDDFPERFSKWLDQFIEHITNNF